MAEAVQHLDVHYSGRVQGVGFRYHTLQIAKEFEISGYVANLADGRVRLEAEGAAGEVGGFREEVEKQLQPFIREVQVNEETREPRFSGFTIK